MDGFQRIGGLIMNTSLTSLLPSQQMLSSDISAITNIRLDSVKRTIERLAERRVITLPPTVEKPTAGRTSTEYVFSGEQGKLDSITAAIVKRWYELEKRTPAFDINNPQHLLNAIEVQAKQNLQLNSENKILTKAIETITHTEHGVKFQQACKILNTKQHILAKWLREHGWDRYLNDARASTYYSESRGYCETKYSHKEGVKPSGQSYSYTQTEFFILPKGMQILAKRFGERP